MTSEPKTLFRQFGSKSRVADKILSLVPPGARIWCELCCGTAAVTLAKPPHPEEHINDMNGEIVDLFRLIRDPEKRRGLIEAVELTPWSQEEYQLAKSGEAVACEIERTRRFLVRSWQGINGDSAKGTSWASFDGASKARAKVWDGVPDRIVAVARRFKNVCIHRKPAVKLLEMVGRYAEAVVFVDPPYPADTLADGRAIYKVDMAEQEHLALIKALNQVDCRVILTMNPGTVYDDGLAAWHRQDLPVRGLQNAVKSEVVFCNFDPARVGLFHEVG